MLTHDALLTAIPHCLNATDFPELGEKYEGKVRDVYIENGRCTLITTDRISAFGRVLGLIPCKGQVLNQLSAWWFEQTADILPNHVISVPDPNVTIARSAAPLPIEIVVRGYITGVTKTSLWTLYEQGERRPYGVSLPDGLQKNDRLPRPIITPTTKAAQGGRDEQLTVHALSRGLVAGVSPDLWRQIEHAALMLFRRGQAIAAEAGLILVDTKYEMGLIDGRLTLIDEIHTPDSSRYWLANSVRPGVEPQHFDKEFMRKWFTLQNYHGDGRPPTMPSDLIALIAARYITAYEKLTGQSFVPGKQPAVERIRGNL